MALRNQLMAVGASAQLAAEICGTDGVEISAGGNSQTTAVVLTKSLNLIGNVTSGSGVMLLSSLVSGESQEIINLTVLGVNVYPPIGGNINGLATNAPYVLNPNTRVNVMCATAGTAYYIASVTQALQPVVTNSLFVENFRALGDTDNMVWAKAITAMQTPSPEYQKLVGGSRVYNISSPIIIGGAFLNLDLTQSSFTNTDMAHQPIIAAGAANFATNTYPTATDPNVMSGCCFYFTTNIYYALVEGGSFYNFRFANAYLSAHNSPTFRGQTYNNCNAGFIHYTTSQNTRIIGCSTNNCQNLRLSACVCYNAGSPYANQDNYTDDGFFFSNEDTYSSQQVVPNAYFDAWFQANILQPTVGSYSVANSNYIYPYATTHDFCNPSGCAIYSPFRNPRFAFGWTCLAADLRLSAPKGMAMIATNILGFRVELVSYETIFNDGSPAPTQPVFKVQQIQNGCLVSGLGNISGTDVNHPIVADANNTEAATSPYLRTLCYIGSNVVEQPALGQKNNSWSADQFITTLGSGQNVQQDGRNNGPVTFGQDFSDNNSGGKVIYCTQGGNYISESSGQIYFDLPYQKTDGSWTNNCNLSVNDYPCGMLEVAIINCSTGERDYGQFYIDINNNSLTFTTSTAVNNGDTSIPLTANFPAGTYPAKYSVWLFNGVKVVLDYFDATTNLFHVIGHVGGMGSTAAAGSSLAHDYLGSPGANTGVIFRPIKKFDRTFATVSMTAAMYSNGGSIGVLNNVSAGGSAGVTTYPSPGVSLRVMMKFTNLMVVPPEHYSTGVPTDLTTYVAGAIRYENAAPAAAGSVSYYQLNAARSAWLTIKAS